ncbi:MAG: OB-fold nucleic acid binding domain-containing protein, partial [Solirubrobacteraceae bacterium]
MTPRTFAEGEPLDPELLRAAPVHSPRPSRLAQPLRFEHSRAAKAAAGLGLTTVGELLEHLPRDRREARCLGELVVGETATVIVEVRAIASRRVRRRGMRPLVCATVADGTGTVEATFFNQPWLAQKYPRGTRLVLHGRYEARNRFRVQGHATTTETAAAGAGAVGHYAATEGLSSTQILALVREHAAALADVPEPLPARVRVAERLPDRGAALAAAHLGDERRQELGRSRLAFDELLLVQLALLRRRR